MVRQKMRAMTDSSGDRTRSGQIGEQRGHIVNERGHIGEVRRHVTKRRNKMFDSEFLTPAGYSSSSPQSDDPEVDAQPQQGSTSWLQADAVGDSDHSVVYGNSSRARMYTNSTLIGLDLDNSFLQRMASQTISGDTPLDWDIIRLIRLGLQLLPHERQSRAFQDLESHILDKKNASSQFTDIKGAASALKIQPATLIAYVQACKQFDALPEEEAGDASEQLDKASKIYDLFLRAFERPAAAAVVGADTPTIGTTPAPDDDPEVGAQFQGSTSWLQANAGGGLDHSFTYGNSSRAHMYTNSTLTGLDLDNSFLQRMASQTLPDITVDTLLDLDTIRIISRKLEQLPVSETEKASALKEWEDHLLTGASPDDAGVIHFRSLQDAASALQISSDLLIGYIKASREYADVRKRFDDASAAFSGALKTSIGAAESRKGEEDTSTAALKPASGDDFITVRNALSGQELYRVRQTDLSPDGGNGGLTSAEKLKLSGGTDVRGANSVFISRDKTILTDSDDLDQILKSQKDQSAEVIVNNDGRVDSRSWAAAAYAFISAPYEMGRMRGQSDRDRFSEGKELLRTIRIFLAGDREWKNSLSNSRQGITIGGPFMVGEASVRVAVYQEQIAKGHAEGVNSFCALPATDTPTEEQLTRMCDPAKQCNNDMTWISFGRDVIGGNAPRNRKCIFVALVDMNKNPRELVEWMPFPRN
ncbi:unnamed protein product [Amoebophrya sp. A25]|nr:unnamed protein product [Amoebophrya sp. A25]|eukprot:GSA25T00009441001.1